MEERARIRMTGELEVIEVNSAAARLLAIHPLDLLGRPGSAAPEPWGPALSEAGRDTEVVRWAAEPTGWSVHLSPPAAADLDGLFAAAALADSEEAARGLFGRWVAEELPGAAVWLRAEDGRFVPVAEGEAFWPDRSWAVRFGEPHDFTSPSLLPPVPAGSTLPVASRPVFGPGGAIGLVLLPLPVEPGLDEASQRAAALMRRIVRRSG